MAITIRPDGTISVETPDDLRIVLDVQAARAATARPATPASPAVDASADPLPEAVEPSRVPPSRFLASGDRVEGYRELYHQIGRESPTQRLLIDSLFLREMSDAELRMAVGVPRNQDLRGLLIGIVRRANNRKLPGLVAKQMRRTDGGRKRTYVYSLTSESRHALDGLAGRGQEKLAM
jgi:hypothetical protein